MVMDNIQYTPKEGNRVVVPLYGQNLVQKMPELIAQGYKPISIAQIMEERLKEAKGLEVARENDYHKIWGGDDLYSGDSILYHPDGRIKVVLDSKKVRNINDISSLKNGSIVLPKGTFEKRKGVEFSKKDTKRFTGKSLELSKILKNEIWLTLARGDKKLLTEYAGEVSLRSTSRMLMNILVNDAPEFETESLWSLGHINDSNVFGGDFWGLSSFRILYGYR